MVTFFPIYKEASEDAIERIIEHDVVVFGFPRANDAARPPAAFALRSCGLGRQSDP